MRVRRKCRFMGHQTNSGEVIPFFYPRFLDPAFTLCTKISDFSKRLIFCETITNSRLRQETGCLIQKKSSEDMTILLKRCYKGDRSGFMQDCITTTLRKIVLLPNIYP